MAGTALEPAPLAFLEAAVLPSLAGRRRHLHRRLHRPGRCQHRAACPADAAAAPSRRRSTTCAGSPSPICWPMRRACRCSPASARWSAASCSISAGFALFGVASLMCGLAQDLPTLIAFRALQGIGGSLLGANSIAILVKSVPGDQRAHAIGCFTAAQAIGVSVGPVVGGLLLASLGWQWVFWVAVPFSARGRRAGLAGPAAHGGTSSPRRSTGRAPCS